MDLSTFNESQVSAVLWQEGPLLLLASPGSGKTMTLVARLGHLVAQAGSQHHRILCLTYNRLTRMHIQERLLQLVPDVQDKVLVTTFHAFAIDVLRQHGSHLGLNSGFEILPHAERIDLVKSVLLDRADELTKFISAERALEKIDFLFHNAIPDEEVIAILGDAESAEQLRIIFMRYKQLLIKQNCLDFDSALYFCVQLFRERPRVGQQLQLLYRHICVDEFQDLTVAQYHLLRALAPERNANVFLAGDDDQSIFQWIGASPTRLNDLARDYNLSVIQLPQNYRAPPEIVSLANALIAHNSDRFPAKLKMEAHSTPYAATSRIELLSFIDDDREADGIAVRVAQLLRDGALPSEIAVLSRTTRHLRPIQEALGRRSLLNHVQRSKTPFESAPLRLIDAALKLALVRSDKELAAMVAKALADCVEQNFLVKDLVQLSAQLNVDHLEALGALVAGASSFGAEIQLAVSELVKGNYPDFIRIALAHFDAVEQRGRDAEEQYSEYSTERAAWQDMIQQVGQGRDAYALPLNKFLEEITLANRGQAMPPDAIRCMTIHASKGLEFRHVFMVGMFEGHFPSLQSTKAGGESREMQEERRICFVAITRTRETLTLSLGKGHNGRRREPSRFLVEMGLLPSMPA